MESIMRTIVDMDKRARERNNQAKKDLEQVDTEILAQSEAMKAREQARAKQKILQIKAENEEKISRSLSDISEKSAEVSKSLDDLYAQKGEQWANSLVQMALKD